MNGSKHIALIAAALLTGAAALGGCSTTRSSAPMALHEDGVSLNFSGPVGQGVTPLSHRATARATANAASPDSGAQPWALTGLHN